MALFDFLQPIAQPIMQGLGQLGEKLQDPKTYQPLQEDISDLMPYVIALGPDNPRLPEILMQLRGQRREAKAREQQEQISSIGKFFSAQGYNVVPGAEESLLGIQQKYFEAPQELLNKAIAANYVRQKPVSVQVTRVAEKGELVKKYTGLDEEALRQVLTTQTDPVELGAIQKAAQLKGISLRKEVEVPTDWDTLVNEASIGAVLYDGASFQVKTASGKLTKVDVLGSEVEDAIREGTLVVPEGVKLPPGALEGIPNMDPLFRKLKDPELRQLWVTAGPKGRENLKILLERFDNDEAKVLEEINRFRGLQTPSILDNFNK